MLFKCYSSIYNSSSRFIKYSYFHSSSKFFSTSTHSFNSSSKNLLTITPTSDELQLFTFVRNSITNVNPSFYSSSSPSISVRVAGGWVRNKVSPFNFYNIKRL